MASKHSPLLPAIVAMVWISNYSGTTLILWGVKLFSELKLIADNLPLHNIVVSLTQGEIICSWDL